MENAELLRSTRSYHHGSESSIKFSDSDKFFCKLLEKDTEQCIKTDRNPSFRVYYGDSKGSVPFLWEMAPGTPKQALSLDKNTAASVVVPPLTPPPSYTKDGSGNVSVKRWPQKCCRGSGRGIGQQRQASWHFKYLFGSHWTCVLGRKAPLPLRSWRSVERFWTSSGKGREGIHNKFTFFYGCFSS